MDWPTSTPTGDAISRTIYCKNGVFLIEAKPISYYAIHGDAAHDELTCFARNIAAVEHGGFYYFDPSSFGILIFELQYTDTFAGKNLHWQQQAILYAFHMHPAYLKERGAYTMPPKMKPFMERVMDQAR